MTIDLRRLMTDALAGDDAAAARLTRHLERGHLTTGAPHLWPDDERAARCAGENEGPGLVIGWWTVDERVHAALAADGYQPSHPLRQNGGRPFHINRPPRAGRHLTGELLARALERGRAATIARWIEGDGLDSAGRRRVGWRALILPRVGHLDALTASLISPHLIPPGYLSPWLRDGVTPEALAGALGVDGGQLALTVGSAAPHGDAWLWVETDETTTQVRTLAQDALARAWSRHLSLTRALPVREPGRLFAGGHR